MLKYLFGIVCLLTIALTISAQGLETMPIDFEVNGRILPSPYAGGLRVPQFSEIDINRDGKKDLFVFDKASKRVMIFINEGEVGQIAYRYDDSYAGIFPKLKTWAFLRDYNQDGIEDLFIGNNINSIDGIQLWEATVSNGDIGFEQKQFGAYQSPVLQLENDEGTSQNLEFKLYNFPEVVDVDGDGDVDILVFNDAETHVLYYKNQSIERSLPADGMIFTLEDDCFGRFEVKINSPDILLSEDKDICAKGLISDNPIQNRLHGGSSIKAFDQYCDGLVDLLIGDGGGNSLKSVINGGSVQQAWMVETTSKYPQETPVNISLFTSAYQVDANNDGLLDLIAVQNDWNFGQTNDHIWLFINATSNCEPTYRLETKNFLIDQMLYFEASSHPTTCDFNQDGLIDILIGGHVVDSLETWQNRLYLFENKGPKSNPVYQLVDVDYLKMSTVEIGYAGNMSPTFGDLDSDGDQDLVIGDGYGSIYFWENIAGPNMPYQFETPIYPYQNIYLGINAVPQIVDIDKDGLQDLLISTWKHDVVFFRNIGSTQEPSFDGDKESSVNVRGYGHFFPTKSYDNVNGAICTYQTDDGMYVLLGLKDGSISKYGPISESLTDSLPKLSSFSDAIYFGNTGFSHMADLNDDGKYELLIGNDAGGFIVYKTEELLQQTSHIFENEAEVYNIYPNPTTDQLHIVGQLDKIAVLDSFGNEYSTIPFHPSDDGILLQVSSLKSGVYTIIITQDHKTFITKFIKI